MVLKTTVCRFSGLRIYPGKGILFVRVDGQQFLFLNKKCKSLYNNRLRPAKLAWTVAYRKQHFSLISGLVVARGRAAPTSRPLQRAAILRPDLAKKLSHGA